MTGVLIEEFLAAFDDSRFPNDFLQQYELMECLSHNEQGETLLIQEQRTGKYFVAKCYPVPCLASHTSESDLLKKLQHKGLPAYIGEYHNDKMRCIVREFAPGKSLDRLVQEKPLTRQQAISIIAQLCDILIYLHGQTPPIIHRDIKPQNIIVDEQENVTLIDFGISRRYDENAQEDTRSFGTRHYAAPEQYGFAQTDCRSDIYSLGVLFCWLLTAKEDVQQAKKEISSLWLAKIVEKCTAFAPKDRYKNAAQVRNALAGPPIRRYIRFTLFAALILLAAAFFYSNLLTPPTQKPGGITFKEPLIEQAVRLALEKSPSDEITEQDLLSISEVFVFGDEAAADEGAFKEYVNRFANNDRTILRGSISRLDDLPKLKNLRRISLGYQNIVDLTPLAELDYLESVDLQHNPIKDVSALSRLRSLSSLTVFDTYVSDLTILHNCSHLSTVDAGYTQIKSTAALEGLHALRTLAMRKAPLQSLEKIETLPLLERIYLTETQLLDLSPLLNLPRLQMVEVDESMRKAAEAVAEEAQFEIIFQK